METHARGLEATLPDDLTSSRTGSLNIRQKGIGVVRILFGVAWAIAALLKWQPAFIAAFASTVGGATDGQPMIVKEWIGLWVHIVQINPTIFGVMAAVVETVLALCFILGAFTNTASIVGIVWSFIIWSVAEGFGGPFVAGQSTDIGTAFPYIILCALLLLLGSGRYLGLDHMLTTKLGKFGFLAAGPLKK